MASGNQPNFYLAFTAKDGRDYVKGPSVGMWDADKGPKARGNIKGEYLEKLIDFLKDFERDSVSVALFENDGEGGSSRRGGRSRDRDEDRRSDRDRDEREERSSRRGRDEEEPRGSRRSRDEDEDEDEFGKDRERGSSRRESSSSSRRSSKPAKKSTKKGRK